MRGKSRHLFPYSKTYLPGIKRERLFFKSHARPGQPAVPIGLVGILPSTSPLVLPVILTGTGVEVDYNSSTSAHAPDSTIIDKRWVIGSVSGVAEIIRKYHAAPGWTVSQSSSRRWPPSFLPNAACPVSSHQCAPRRCFV